MTSRLGRPAHLGTAGIRALVCVGLLTAIVGIVSAEETGGSLPARKKVLYVNAYHPGYEWSDGITRSICKVFGTRMRNGRAIDTSKSLVSLKVVYMDTKHHHTEAFKINAGERVKHLIDAWGPDLVITSDDNTAKYLIVPYFINASLPFVFCGINWDCSEYGLPCDNITGMVEVQLVDQILHTLRHYARGKRIAFIKGDDFSARREARFYENRLQAVLDKRFVTTFAQWQAAYLDLQETADIILVGNSASIHGWDDQAAQTLVAQRTVVPTGNWDAWMARFALVTFATKPEEQGRWAATTALKILSGIPPNRIPVAFNKIARVILNMPLAKKLGIRFPMELINQAAFISE